MVQEHLFFYSTTLTFESNNLKNIAFSSPQVARVKRNILRKENLNPQNLKI